MGEIQRRDTARYDDPLEAHRFVALFALLQTIVHATVHEVYNCLVSSPLIGDCYNPRERSPCVNRCRLRGVLGRPRVRQRVHMPRLL